MKKLAIEDPKQFCKDRADKAKEESFPKDPLERSYLRTGYLWRGLLHMLKKNDYYRLWEALRSVGLVDKGEIFYAEHLFERNPSDDTLRGLKKFSELKTFPKLRGKKRPERDFLLDLLSDELLDDYYMVLHVLKTLPPKSKPESRFKAIRDRCLPKILSRVNLKELARRLGFATLSNGIETDIKENKINRDIEDRLLRRWCGLGSSQPPLPDKRLAEEVMAHIYGLKRETLRKYLTKAKSKLPDIFRKAMMDPKAYFPSQMMELLNTPFPDTE